MYTGKGLLFSIIIVSSAVVLVDIVLVSRRIKDLKKVLVSVLVLRRKYCDFQDLERFRLLSFIIFRSVIDFFNIGYCGLSQFSLTFSLTYN